MMHFHRKLQELVILICKPREFSLFVSPTFWRTDTYKYMSMEMYIACSHVNIHLDSIGDYDI